MSNFLLKRRAKTKIINLSYVDKRTPWWKPLILISPALIVITIFILLPFVLAARDSAAHYADRHHKGAIAFGPQTFEKLFRDNDFGTAIRNTITYALISVPILISLSAVISAVIASIIRKRLRGFWQTVFFLPYVTSAIAIALAFAYLFEQDHGLINQITGDKTPWLKDPIGYKAIVPMLVNGIWKGMAFNILIFTTTMLSVNKNLYKSASIDGASSTKQFFKITLPSIKRSTSFLVFMAIIGSTKVFPLALFSNNAEQAVTYHGTTLMLYIYYQIQSPNGVFLAGAASISLVVISISMTIILKGGITNIIKFVGFISEKRIQRKVARQYG